MAPAYPISGGGQGPWVINFQGVEESGPLVCSRKNGHPIGYQTPEDYRRRSIIQGSRGGGTRETEVPAHLPGIDRDLSAV